MTLHRNKHQGYSSSHLLRLGGGLLGAGFLLFAIVWWPIQAERNLLQLTQWEQKLSLKKAELQNLQSRYAALTSLHVLDQWAVQHGPWHTPGKDDVILVSN